MKNILFNIQRTFGISNEEMDLLEQKMEIVVLEKNDFFLREGEKSDRVGFVESGSLRLFYGSEDKELCNDFYFENSVVCSFASLLSGRSSRVNIVAIESTEMLCFNYEDVMFLMKASERLNAFAGFILQEHLIRTEKREAELLRTSSEERFRILLEEHPKIFKRIPLHYVASYLNITPETLSRYRSKL